MKNKCSTLLNNYGSISIKVNKLDEILHEVQKTQKLNSVSLLSPVTITPPTTCSSDDVVSDNLCPSLPVTSDEVVSDICVLNTIIS